VQHGDIISVNVVLEICQLLLLGGVGRNLMGVFSLLPGLFIFSTIDYNMFYQMITKMSAWVMMFVCNYNMINIDGAFALN
jgi:hypothetical protein